MQKSIKTFFAIALFILILFFATFPLLRNINAYIPGFQNTDEPFAVLQGFWWQKYAAGHHVSALNEDVTAYPFGVPHEKVYLHPLWFHTVRILSIWTNEIIAYNLHIIFNLFLAFIATYYLVRFITGQARLAFFSAIIYALCPYQFARIWQHFSLTFTGTMPLYLLGLLKLYRQGRGRDVLFCVFTFYLVILTDMHYAFFMLVATCIFMLYAFFRRFEMRGTKSFKPYVSAALLMAVGALIIILPFLLKVSRTIKTAKPSVFSLVRPFEDLFAQSARPLSYFLPSPMHPVLGKFTEQFVGTGIYGTSFTEHVLYLGWLPLILAFVAFRRWRRKKEPVCRQEEKFYIGFFIYLAIAAWVFSQPPWWNFGPLKVPMPSQFVYKVMPMFRAYCRFGILLMLAIAVMAGFGLNFFSARFKTKNGRLFFLIFACALVLFEFWNYPPFKVIDVSRVPAVYSWLKAQPGDFVIAEYPIDAASADEHYKFYQTRHEKRVINGTNPGMPGHNLAQVIIRLSVNRTAGILKWMGVKYVLVHRDGYLNTELAQDADDLFRIPHNPGLKFVRNFSSQDCPETGIMCTRKTGDIDVYEVVAEQLPPEANER